MKLQAFWPTRLTRWAAGCHTLPCIFGCIPATGAYNCFIINMKTIYNNHTFKSSLEQNFQSSIFRRALVRGSAPLTSLNAPQLILCGVDDNCILAACRWEVARGGCCFTRDCLSYHFRWLTQGFLLTQSPHLQTPCFTSPFTFTVLTYGEFPKGTIFTIP